MTTKRKVRRPKELIVRTVMGCDFVYLPEFVENLKQGDAKRLIRWLTQAVAWLEQEGGK